MALLPFCRSKTCSSRCQPGEHVLRGSPWDGSEPAHVSVQCALIAKYLLQVARCRGEDGPLAHPHGPRELLSRCQCTRPSLESQGPTRRSDGPLEITHQFWTGCSAWGCWWAAAAKPRGGVCDLGAGSCPCRLEWGGLCMLMERHISTPVPHGDHDQGAQNNACISHLRGTCWDGATFLARLGSGSRGAG